PSPAAAACCRPITESAPDDRTTATKGIGNLMLRAIYQGTLRLRTMLVRTLILFASIPYPPNICSARAEFSRLAFTDQYRSSRRGASICLNGLVTDSHT